MIGNAIAMIGQSTSQSFSETFFLSGIASSDICQYFLYDRDMNLTGFCLKLGQISERVAGADIHVFYLCLVGR